jgi:hypothetical protein
MSVVHLYPVLERERRDQRVKLVRVSARYSPTTFPSFAVGHSRIRFSYPGLGANHQLGDYR